MKRILLIGLLITTTFFVFGQKADAVINVKEVERIERVLAADEMRGRRAFSPEIDKAADFISDEFKKAGLQAMSGNNGYKQEFAMIRPKSISAGGNLDGEAIEAKDIIAVTCFPQLKINQASGYEKIYIKPGDTLQNIARRLVRSNKNILVLVNKSFANNFGNLTRLKNTMFKTDKSVVFVLTDKDPAKYAIEAVHEITEQELANVVGILPGKSKKDEHVIFSAHYDHIGVGKAVDGDSIYNGANDDAAGTTAVIMLAKYFKALANNERTIVFAAFTAEEVGGYGSQYFSRQFDPAKVMAMFNIEMIGTESKWGKNSAYITGYEKTDMGAIMQKNLEGTGFTFHPDPYPQQQLFYRSDNATLARLGVPAHTISTSKMDSEPNYHKVTDHIETLDMENMAMIIKSIALASRSIVAGKDSPTRVKVDELR
ncbi:MAG TPA: M28 family peptidase [Chitinophagaceae bacterium]